MTQQYLRKVSLVLANKDKAIDCGMLHVKFSIKQFTLETPNIAQIRVYNLAYSTEQWVMTQAADVIINAGYEGDGGLNTIFKGEIVQVRRGRESPVDTYLDITAMDGDESYIWTIVTSVLAAGSTFKQRVDAIASAMGMDVAHYPQNVPSDNEKLARGKTFFVMGRDAMRDQAMWANSNWTIQNGQIVLVSYTGYLPEEAVVMNAKTGLIGFPEQTESGIQIKSLLNPRLHPNARVQIDNNDIIQSAIATDVKDIAQNVVPQRPMLNDDGIYRIIVLEHSGDTRGNEYYSDMICLSVTQKEVTPETISHGYTPAS